jgi:protein ImuB
MTGTRLCTLVWPRWPHLSEQAFEPLVRAVADLVPLVEVGGPGVLSFATRGPSRYLGGDEALAARVGEIVAAVSFEAGRAHAVPAGVGPAGVGIADGRLAAALAAHRSAAHGRAVVVPPGESPAFLAPVPVRALADLGGLPLDLVERLGRLGLSRLGDVAAMESADLLARFGHPGREAHVLAGGGDVVPLAPRPPKECREVVCHLDEPLVHLDAVVFASRRLTEELAGSLAAEGQVCTRLRVEVETEHGERSQRCWSHAEGMSAIAMLERVRWQMDGWVEAVTESSPTGGVVLVRLTAEVVRADRGRQPGLWGGQGEADTWAVRAMARVAGLLGPDAVTVPEWRGGRDPWQQYRLVAATAIDPDQRVVRVAPVATPWPGRLPAPAPARVLPEPWPARLDDTTGAPVRVSGRGELSAPPARLTVREGRPRDVVGWAGPWPVEERWWDPRRHRRQARVQVVVDDGEALLLVIEQGRWWVRAVYA